MTSVDNLFVISSTISGSQLLRDLLSQPIDLVSFREILPTIQEIFIEKVKVTMRKLAYIIQREYITRVRTKTFLITTFLVPLLFIGLPFLMVFILNYSAGSIQNIGISDTNGLLDSVVLADKEDELFYVLQKSGVSLCR